ncbi:hypothetical protein BU17DRAFT_48090 [Hysterangium stoloniferum]|nr:hypothetical protein BU17DRAFT_48090 [Hysterangium stoloniferum]
MAEEHNHSHSGPHAHTHTHGPQPQQTMNPPAPDPLLVAALDARFREVPLKLVPSADGKAPVQIAPATGNLTDDFSVLNALLSQMATVLPSNHVVPPPIDPATVMQNPRSAAVVKAKDEGNKLYAAQKYAQAIQMYTTAADITMSRPPWESSNLIKEELAMVLSNRSAAHAISGEWAAALVDADAVVQIKRPWSKGHFRKAKALQGLGEYEDAKVALSLGLSFEPSNTEMLQFLAELEEQIREQASQKAAQRARKD